MDAILEPIHVMFVKAVGGTSGAPHAFDTLESKLPSLRGRKFYATYDPLTKEYRACVQTLPGEEAKSFGLESGTIPGGKFVKKKVTDWQSKIPQLPGIVYEMATGRRVDPTRPTVEFYRSSSELILYLPVQE